MIIKQYLWVSYNVLQIKLMIIKQYLWVSCTVLQIKFVIIKQYLWVSCTAFLSLSFFCRTTNTVYIHNDSFPFKSAFLPPFRFRKRNLSDFCLIFTTDGEYVLSIYLLIAIFSDWKHRWRNTIHTRNRNKILRDLTGR